MTSPLSWVLADVLGTSIGVLFVLAIAILTVVVTRKRARAMDETYAWRRAAAAYGLLPGGGPFVTARRDARPGFQWHGRVEGHELLGEVTAAGFTVIRIRGGLPTDRDVFHSLAADTRAFVDTAFAEGWNLEDRELVGTFAGTRGATFEHEIQRGLRLATLLSAPRARIGADLVARVADDPNAAVRSLALQMLGSGRYGAEMLAQAVAQGVRDPDLEIRCLAATLGNDTALLARLAREGWWPALDLLVDHPIRLDTARETLVFLLSHKGERSWAWRTNLARALGRCPVPGAEDALIAMLEFPDDDLRTAAMEALGVLGTIAAVPALTPLRDALLPIKLKALAAETIRAIQARAGNPERGALALADAVGVGDLALSDER